MGELIRSASCLSKDTFTRISIAVGFMAEMLAELEQSSPEPGRTVHEALGSINSVFRAQLPGKHLRDRQRSGCMRPDVSGTTAA